MLNYAKCPTKCDFRADPLALGLCLITWQIYWALKHFLFFFVTINHWENLKYYQELSWTLTKKIPKISMSLGSTIVGTFKGHLALHLPLSLSRTDDFRVLWKQITFERVITEKIEPRHWNAVETGVSEFLLFFCFVFFCFISCLRHCFNYGWATDSVISTGVVFVFLFPYPFTKVFLI